MLFKSNRIVRVLTPKKICLFTCLADCKIAFVLVRNGVGVGSRDPFFDPITFLSLFQVIEILICITIFF